MSAGCFYKKWNPVHLKKYSKIHIHSGGLFCYILVPMKISESIEAHQSTAVAAISQRNQATLPGHLIFNFPIFKIFNRLAKASGFCLYFYDRVMLTLNLLQGKHPGRFFTGFFEALPLRMTRDDFFHYIASDI